ncbi:hypothetical protein FD755_009534 [Muntiacus reevesi]|uniref:Major facilitator superfamily (MFS) profile domain-containing protein n=1 Tax=Muntiacus reevesi TaxID=9886 RepID=A0A5N3XZ71_MUNRE|nr:hypothetical protein FD755_009534 [Muntiacus reevesi]
MSRKASENVEYTLRSLSSLMGERRRKQQEPDAASTAGERSLLAAAESSASLQGAGAGGGGVGDLERAARRQFQQDETPAFVYVVAVFSALGGFLFGYDTGVVSGAMLLLKRQLSLDALWQELLVSGTVGAAAVSALAGGALNGAFGRRAAILLASALFAAGSAVLAAANNKETLLAGRLVVGLGIGDRASHSVKCYVGLLKPKMTKRYNRNETSLWMQQRGRSKSVLAWRIPGTGSLVGCRLWGRTESDTTEGT